MAVGDAAHVAAIRVWQQFVGRYEPPPEYLASNKDPQHLAAIKPQSPAAAQLGEPGVLALPGGQTSS
jgi:hypothetical protein